GDSFGEVSAGDILVAAPIVRQIAAAVGWSLGSRCRAERNLQCSRNCGTRAEQENGRRGETFVFRPKQQLLAKLAAGCDFEMKNVSPFSHSPVSRGLVPQLRERRKVERASSNPLSLELPRRG